MSEENNRSPKSNLTNEELLTAKSVIQSFSTACKNYFLYPPGHAYSKSSLEKLSNDFAQFLNKYETLRLNVKGNGFYYRGHPIFQGDSVDSNPAYLLTRDTILFLEFNRGIELTEITLLFDILNRHRNPTDEVEGDIATSLWHYSFAHIEYEAADIFAMEAIEFDVSMFKPVPETENGTKKTPADQAAGKQNTILLDVAINHDIARNSDLSVLKPDEQETLNQLVIQEQTKEIVDDVIDILLIILTIETEQLDFATTLEFLEFEFFDALRNESFPRASKICRNVYNVSGAIKAKKPWTLPLTNLFFNALAKKERLADLSWIRDYDASLNPEQVQYICSIFSLLPSEIIYTLAPLAAGTPIDKLDIRNKFIEIITGKAKADQAAFTKLMAESDEETSLLLFPSVEQMDKRSGIKVYAAMTHHPSATVRRIGLDGYFKTNNLSQPEEVSHLLADDDEKVRQRILNYLEQIGGTITENIIVSFLTKDAGAIDDDYHILHCYKVLSQCNSEKSLEFLREILLESRWTKMFSTKSAIHKHGAAYALKSLGTDDAMDILNQGSQSVRPDVRQVCQKILED